MSLGGSEIGRLLNNDGRSKPLTVENSPADSKSTAGSNSPTWNSSTMCLEKRLQDNQERRYEEVPLIALRKREARSLAIIRRGWNRLYEADEA